MLTIPDLNKLRVFFEVYRHQSLVGASRALKVSRPAVSQNLKSLEDQLDFRLFFRDSKKVVPTDQAHTLYRSLEPLISELGSTLEQLEMGRREPSGHLRIGAPQDFGAGHLTEALVRFKKKHPRVTIELVFGIPTKLLEMVCEGKLDLAFVDNGEVHAQNLPVSALTVMRERFVPVCSQKYFDDHFKHESLKWDDLKSLNFVDYLPNAPVAQMWVQHHFGRRSPVLSVAFSAESVRSLITATLGGLGVAILPERLIQSELQSRKLRLLAPSGGKGLENQIMLVRRLQKTLTARESAFIDFYKALGLPGAA